MNTKCVGDITRIPLTSGKLLYLATVIGLASSRLVGWALVDRMRAELVTDALAVARRCRGSLCNAGTPITDHGTQCTSTAAAAASSASAVRSPAKPHSRHHQLRWHQPHNPRPGCRVKARRRVGLSPPLGRVPPGGRRVAPIARC
ncbi:DDE-type integrase/transposase/recombinase [Streptomyces sp. NPDC058682]|uniref:DDE-type integrase/transposase/recombinase n=1 Tax=Streptomyces sp. NPDC058682 TaxID=3346596 RepID=UPI003665A576